MVVSPKKSEACFQNGIDDMVHIFSRIPTFLFFFVGFYNLVGLFVMNRNT